MGWPMRKAALAPGLPVTLLSAPGAALFAGCLWWREIVAAARAVFPNTEAVDILDCADASGLALGALRSGVRRLVLWPDAPGWERVVDRSPHSQGGFVLQQAPAGAGSGAAECDPAAARLVASCEPDGRVTANGRAELVATAKLDKAHSRKRIVQCA